MKYGFLCLAMASLGMFSSCKKDYKITTQDPPADTRGKVVFKFENFVGTAPLVLGGPAYINAHGDTFSVNLYKYYVSNVVLTNANGEQFAEPESYHLINQADPSRLSFTIKNVPPGTYTAVRLLLGVDSTKNVTGAQSGDLDPMLGMFWNWNTGYIMAKIEGTSPQVPDLVNNQFSLHLGGFSGFYSVLQTVDLPLTQNLVVAANTGNPSVTIKSDVLKWFAYPYLIDLSIMNQVGSNGEEARELSMNYSTMLSVTKVEN